MAEGDGLTEADAKAAAAVVCERLWGTDPNLKVTECKLNGESWEVVQWAEGGHEGWGCRVVITKLGTLEKAEYIAGE
jgi:hypothetical protein